MIDSCCSHPHLGDGSIPADHNPNNAYDQSAPRQHLLCSQNSPLILLLHKRLLLILLRQNLNIIIRDQRRYTLIQALAQRIQILHPIPVIVLTADNPRRQIRMRLAQAGDVDVQSVAGVDPARVDDVLSVAALALAGPGVDVEQVGPRTGERRGGVVVQRAVVAGC